MDFDGLSTKQVMALTPGVSMRLLGFIQEAMPLRLKEVHIVKQPFIFNMVWTIFKPFVKEKLKGRVSSFKTIWKQVIKLWTISVVLPRKQNGVSPQTLRSIPFT